MSLAEDRILRIIELREAGRSYASVAKALKIPRKTVQGYEHSLKQNIEEVLQQGASTLGEVAKELRLTRTVAGMAMQYFGLRIHEKEPLAGKVTLGEAVESAAKEIMENRRTALEKVREYYLAGERSTLRIAELTGLAPATVYQYGSLLKLSLPTVRSEIITGKIQESIAQGGGIEEICAHVGITPYGLYLRTFASRAHPHSQINLPEHLREELADMRWSTPGKCGSRKIDERITRIRALAAQGKTRLEIREEMGISQYYMYRLAKMENIAFIDHRGRRGIIPYTKTRKLSGSEKVGIIKEALAQGERSLEALVKKAECGLDTLHNLSKRYNIVLPSDIIPYRYRPELDKLVDEGLSIVEIAGRYQQETGKPFTRQAVEQYIARSGQKAYWKRKREERRRENRENNQLSVIEEHQRHQTILQSLELHITHLAQKEGSACQKAVEYMRGMKRTLKPERFEKILALFQLYETVQQQGEKLSIGALAEKTGFHPTEVSRILKEANLPTLCQEQFRPSQAVVDEKKKRVYKVMESGIPLSLVDLEYFTAIGEASLASYSAKLGLRRSYGGWIKRSGKLGSAAFEQLNYRHASRIYEARDAGFSDAEALEYADATERMREYALQHEKKIAPVITKALRILFPEENIKKPYRTSRKSLNDVLLEMHRKV